MRHRILFFTPWYPDKNDPMLGLFVRKHALAVSEMASTGVVAVLQADRQQKKFRVEYEQFDSRLDEIRVYYRKSSSGVTNVFRTLTAFRKGYRQYVKRIGKPDLIHANILTRSAVAAWLASVRYRIPYVISEHWSRYLPENYSYRGFLRKKMTELVAGKAKAVIVPSEQLEQAMKRSGITGKYVVVPNVIDEKLFTLPEQKADLPKKRIVHISCFEDRSKNISGLLMVAQKLKEMRDDFELHLVGTGQDFEKMKVLSNQLHVDDVVFFHGLLENEQLSDLLKTATCSVLPSNYETFGIVVYESLCCGVPVVVTDMAGFGKIITPDLGIVVSSGDPEILLEGLTKMLNNAENFDPQHLRNFVLSRYTGRKIAEQLIEIYGFRSD